jgi:glycosyltransferase involved in cell wall biosynthesis
MAGADRVKHLTWPMVKELRELNAALDLQTNGEHHAALDDRLLPYTIDRLRRAVRKVRSNWFQLLSPTHVVLSPWAEGALLERYQAVVDAAGGDVVCIIEHPCFQRIVEKNRTRGIPTIAAFHNLESLDVGGPLDLGRRLRTWSRLGDVASELNVLRACDERLFISGVEAGLVSGIGMTAKHYPYRAVGEVAEWLAGIRAQRATRARATAKTNLVMLGSAVHPSTAKGFRWFLELASRHGLPPGVEVHVVGAGTDTLAPGTNGRGAIHFRGWVSAQELEELLVNADAAILPQREGFGALTRLPELAAAGIPVVTSEHAALAAGHVAGVQVVDDEWESWLAAIERVRSVESVDAPELEVAPRDNALARALARLARSAA